MKKRERAKQTVHHTLLDILSVHISFIMDMQIV